MGKVKYLTIVLQKASPTYSCGDTLEGVVKFRMNERVIVHSLKCTITGGSCCFRGKF
jgi:hypothetical protein